MIQLKLHKKLNAADGVMYLEVDTQVAPGTFVSINGPSGAGKTSLLRMLSGLMKPDSGRLVIGNEIWFDSDAKINLKPQLRQIGFVFQDAALFPNMTVWEQIEYALPKKHPKSSIKELLNLMELGELSKSKPDTLSGGQRQRVALARALVREPRLLLLDEPLSSLDPEMRKKLQDYLTRIHKKFGMTIFMVSHDEQEAVRLATERWQFRKGKIIQKNFSHHTFKIDKKPATVFTGFIKSIKNEGNLSVIVLESQDGLHQILVNNTTTDAWKPGNRITVKIENLSK
jgi:molybdate transport system ATP-binding protein